MLNIKILIHIFRHIFNRMLSKDHPLTEIILLSEFKPVSFLYRLTDNIYVDGYRLVGVYTQKVSDKSDLVLKFRIYQKRQKGSKSLYCFKWSFGDSTKRDGLYGTVYSSEPFSCTILEFSKAIQGLDDSVTMFQTVKKMYESTAEQS